MRLQRVDLGVDTSGLLSLQVQLPRAQYMKENAGVAPGITLVDYSPSGPLLIDRIHEALQGVPGVVHAAGVTNPPLTGHGGVEFLLDGAPKTAQPSFAAYKWSRRTTSRRWARAWCEGATSIPVTRPALRGASS